MTVRRRSLDNGERQQGRRDVSRGRRRQVEGARRLASGAAGEQKRRVTGEDEGMKERSREKMKKLRGPMQKHVNKHKYTKLLLPILHTTQWWYRAPEKSSKRFVSRSTFISFLFYLHLVLHACTDIFDMIFDVMGNLLFA
jgi:hypothetical protein